MAQTKLQQAEILFNNNGNCLNIRCDCCYFKKECYETDLDVPVGLDFKRKKSAIEYLRKYKLKKLCIT